MKLIKQSSAARCAAVAMKPLKRHPDLVELSREHHHALALCVRILRNPSEDHRGEIEAHIPELLKHFEAEENRFAARWGNIDAALRARFETEHRLLRAMMADPQYRSETWKAGFARTLRDHARFEERELFPAIEPYL